MPGTQIRHLDPLGNVRRKAIIDRFNVVDDVDMYRGTGGAGVSLNLGATVAVGYTVKMGTAGAGNAYFGVKNPQSLLFTGSAFSTTGNTVQIVFTITGYDLDGTRIVEELTMDVAIVAKSYSLKHVFAWVDTIVVKSITIGSGTLDTNAVTGCLLAIGHGVSTQAGDAGRCRFPISAKIPRIINPATGLAQVPANLCGYIKALIDPNGAHVAINQVDTQRKTVVNASGTTLVVGEYVLIYDPKFSEYL